MSTINLALRLRHMFPLTRICLSALAVAGLALPAPAAKPKLAVVDVSRAFDAYKLTVEQKEKVRLARAELQRDARLEKIKLLRVELLDIRDNVRDATRTEAERQSAYRTFQLKNQDLQTLQRDTSQALDERSKAIDEAMVHRTRELLGTVQAAVQLVATEGQYDYVFEKSGKTSSQIPPLLYIRDAVDITDRVIEALNSGEIAEKEIATVEKPASARP